MELTYQNPGYHYSIDRIMLFQHEKQSEWWRESLFAFFPQLDRQKIASMETEPLQAYLYDTLLDVYKHEEALFPDKIEKYTEHWKFNQKQIEEAFQTDCHEKLNDMIGHITLNPICPRFLDTHSFDVFYLNSGRGALGMALHEITHFIWFDVWRQHYHDNPEEYETPHLKWLLSEMAVDPVMRNDKRLRDINPYFHDGCVYPYFYQMIIDEEPILDTLNRMYKDSNIIGFMEQAYAYCVTHEAEIRRQIK